jgi:hypothetical protein
MAYRRSLDFLPNVFRTEVNDKFLHATVDQLISEPELRRLDGYIGRRFSPVAGANDSFINEFSDLRQNYQLEPHTTYVDENGKVSFTSGYVDLLRRIDVLGGFTNNHSRLFDDFTYNYDAFIDYDKFLNYSSYYWLPNGPNSVTVFATEIPLELDITVTPPTLYQIVNGQYEKENFDLKGFDTSENVFQRVREDGIKFNITGTKLNPTIRLARGGTYTFQVNQTGHGFFIQTAPGTTEQLSWQNNLSTRDVFGVENNGDDVGTITFRVPEADAQDFFLRMPDFTNTNLVAYASNKNRALRYNEVHYKKYDDIITLFGGIDGQRMLDGKKLVFLKDPASGQNPQPWQQFKAYVEGELIQYGNNVYRVLEDFITGSVFNANKLELYDLQQSWYNPEPFDSVDFSFDATGFDQGDTVSFEQQKGLFDVTINSEGYIVLRPSTVIPRNNKVTVLEGIAYGNKKIYRDSNDDLTVIPLITSTLDRLYYTDSLDPNIGGVIEIVDQNNNLKIDVLGSILGKRSYESPNGVRFTNGLKIRFLEDVIQSEYANKSYYVEGVGESIALVDIDNLIANETWMDVVEISFDTDFYDTEKFAASTNAPLTPDYFVIKRNSIEQSAWVRHNRWFHKDVIDLTAKYNNYLSTIESNARAKRPILEFDPNLQLFNFGQIAKKAVDVIDNVTLDALSIVEGQPIVIREENIINFSGSVSAVEEFKIEKEREGYTVVKQTASIDGVVTIQMKLGGLGGFYVDDIPLYPGMRVIFTADTNPDVRNKIYKVEWIRPQSETNDKSWSFISDGSTNSYDLNFDIDEPSRLKVFVNGISASSQGYFWSYVASTQSLVFSSTLPPDESSISVSIEFEDQIHLILADDSDIVEGDTVLIKQGINNQGKTYHFVNGVWIVSQQKTKVNQPPKFDLYDQNKKSFGDVNVYTSSTFNGNNLFGYETGTSIVDPVLGFKLKYRNINNIGDIVFSDFITKDSFIYRQNQQSITKSTVGGKVKVNAQNRTFTFRNQWRKVRQKSRQLQLQTYFATEYQRNLFRLNAFPAGVNQKMLTNVIVYVNNNLLYTNHYDLQIEDNIAYLLLDRDLNVGDKIDIKVASLESNENSVYEPPLNYTNNPFNKEITELTLGQMRTHIIKCLEDIPNLSDESLSEFNLRDTLDVKTFRGNILQHDGASHLANFFLNSPQANFVNATINAQREYTRYKNRLLQLINELYVVGEPVNQTLDRALSEIVANKNKNFPYFTSDMIPYGNDYTRRIYQVVDNRLDTYDLTEIFDPTVASNKAVLVYLNNVQLLINRDYIFSTTRPVIELDLTSITLVEGDILEIREYTTTDGSYIPATPTKLGLYPLYIPMIVNDGYGENTRQMIRGHDGSLTALFGDIRDAVLLEFETRIYNNIKVKYDVNRFDIWNYIAGAFRQPDYTTAEFNSILSSHFSAWSGANAIAVSDYRQFVANDPFTYNYGRFTNRVDGELMPASSWRGIYKYYFDTDAPHLRPWEMLGFADKPNWWEENYGPAPYTSGNTVLWDDIEAGKILFGERAGIDARFARPGLSKILPVDGSGELLSPIDCVTKDINELDVSGFFKFGDIGPVENAWRQSSEYPFVIQLAIAIMKPAEYFGVNIDTNNQIIDLDDEQRIFNKTGIRDFSNEFVQNEIDLEGNVARVHSYINWISDYCKGRGLDITKNIGQIIRKLESKLGYKVAGYTDKKYLKIITEQYTPTSNNPGVIIPDDDFDIVLNKSAPIFNLTYSGVIVTKTVDGYSVTGYDDNKPYFTIEASAENENKTYIKVGKLAITKYNDGTGELYRVPYGTEFFSIDQVGDFLISYGRYLTRQGFQFTDKLDEDASWYLDWDLAVREFLFYVQQGWDVDVAISLSPVGSKINYRSAFGVVDGLSNRPLSTRILDEDFKIVRASEYTVYRNGRDFNAKIDNTHGIYLIDLDVVEYEHILLFNNITRFNDIIYEPIIGDRQHRLRIQGFKTNDWDGSYSAAGFVINEDNVEEWKSGVNYNKGDIVFFKEEYFTASDKIPASINFELDKWIKIDYNTIKKGLLPNLANRAGLFKQYYDTNQINLEQDAQKLAKNLIGFESRSYMEDLGISDTSQFKFYQGMLSQKGTNSNLDKLLKAKVDNFGGIVNSYEEWALRLGTYGSTDNTRNLQIELDESWAVKDPLVIELLGDNDAVPNGHKGLKSKDIFIKHVPYDKNFINNREYNKNTNDLYTAGYAQLSDVDYASPTRAALNSYVTGSDVGAGDLIWIAADRNNQWNVYRIDETDIRLESLNVISNGNATIRCVNNHNLEKNDLIFIKSDNTNPNVFGFYTVTTIVDARTFVVGTGYGSIQINPFSGFVFKLKSMKFNSSQDVAAQEPLKGWQEGDKLFIDNANNNGWRIYENQKVWEIGTNYRSTFADENDNLGYAVDTDNQNYYMIAGRPGSNNGIGSAVIYSITTNGSLEEIANLTTDSVGVIGVGESVSASNDATFAAGAPSSDDIGFVVIFAPSTETGEFRTQQIIASDTLDLNGEFGYSVVLSNDGNWLAVGQPGADEGYVFLYQRRFVSILPTASTTFTGDGSSTIFALIGDVANPNDVANVIVTQDGVSLVPSVDYTLVGSNLVLTAAPVFGSNIIVTVSRGLPQQTIISDGSTVSYGLTGDNATPTSIYALFVEVDGVIQVPFRDYTLDLIGNQYYVTFNDVPPIDVEIYVEQRTHFELVTAFTSDSANVGDKFGQSLELTDGGRQIIIGAPNTNIIDEDGSTILAENAGKVYVFDRLAETYYADGDTVEYTTNANILSIPYVYVDNKKLVEGEEYTYTIDTITLFTPPKAGALVKIETNNVVQTTELTLESANDDLEDDSGFGESIQICPTNCSLYVGAPRKDSNKINSGKVYRFINQGRFFGVITGTVQDPIITDESVLVINDFFVFLETGDDLDAIVDAINETAILGVTAINDNGYLHLETNSLITGERLLITSALGQPLVDIGLEIFPHQQTINSPTDDHYVEFGKSLAIGQEADILVVGSARASTRLETTIDNKTTYFDARATSFNDIKKQSGAAWMYQFIPVANSSITNPGQFVSAQKLTNPLIDNFDEYGKSIAINNSTIYIGAPSDDTTGNNAGLIFSFNNNENKKSWNTIRSNSPKVDINLINRVFLYNKETQQIVTDLDFIDPVKGKISGLAAQEITYQTSFDPAVYNSSSSGRVWGKEHVGQVWWDISQTRWIDYEQGNISNRGINWNSAFPGSTIICYEWAESILPPTQFVDEKDPTAFPRSNNFNLLSDIDPNTGIVTNRYYYWVAGKRTIPNVKNRRYSTVDLENLIANPRSTGVPFIAFVASNAVALYNCSNLLQDKNIVLSIEYDVVFNENSIHAEFQLISENDAQSIPNDRVVQKLIDSLAGSDIQGNLVPDPKLTLGEKYGIAYRPRQTIYRNRKSALKSAVEYVNLILSRIPARENKNTTNLLSFEEIPSVYADAYDEVVNDRTELGYLNISLYPKNYRVLVRVDEEVSDKWTIYKKVNNNWVLEKVQSFDNRRYITTADWLKPSATDPIVTDYTIDFSYQLISITPSEGDTVKVRDAGNGRYVILQYTNNNYEIIKQESATYKIIDAIWDQTKFAQGFDIETFDIQIFDDWPTAEIQNILRAVYNDIFSGTEQIEKNRWFLLMMQHLLAEQKYVDYIFKTSFIKVEHRNQQAISQIPTLQKDRQDNLRKYIEEIKPYHTKIREFVNSHEGLDTANTSVTDFDIPAYYNETNGKYRSPTGLDEIDDIIFERPEYSAWLNNYTLEVESVVVHKSGSGYSAPPALSLVGTTGSGTTLDATVVNGEITKIDVKSGKGYITTPTIQIGDSSGEGAVLVPIMGNKKVRSIKDTIKFDRVPNNAGFLIQFLDEFENPVDIRNQKKSRVFGEQGVLDELLDALSGFEWVKEEASQIGWPVENASNYRIFPDDSGRIQVQYKKLPGGWTAELLQSYLRSLGSFVGVDELDISGTVVSVDGNMSLYAPTVLEWQSETRYDRGDIIVYNNKAYTLRDSVPVTTTGDTFEITDFRELNADEFESHLNRTWAYYQPAAGLPGKDLGQLFAGVEYPGVKVQGASFRDEPGFDVGAYDINGLDQFIIGPEGVSVLDESVLDQTIYSNFLDTTLGTKPEDIITHGEKFVDTYSSHAPEEAIPGRVYDTLDIRVFTVPANDFADKGLGLLITATVYDVNTSNVYPFNTTITKGDDLIVISKNYGRLDQTIDYTINFKNKTITMLKSLLTNDVLYIYAINGGGEGLIYDQEIACQENVNSYTLQIDLNLINQSLVTLNGEKIEDYELTLFSQGLTTLRIDDSITLTDNDIIHVHLFYTESTEQQFVDLNTELFNVTGNVYPTNYTFTLANEIGYSYPSAEKIIVELNNNRLRPPNQNYYVGDNSTIEFDIPYTRDIDINSINESTVRVALNGEQLLPTIDWDLLPTDGSSIPRIILYSVVPTDLDLLTISLTNKAEYSLLDEKTIIISQNISLDTNDVIRVTTFTNDERLGIKTSVYQGTIESNVLTSIGFDDVGFDSVNYDSVQANLINTKIYDLPTPVNNINYLWVTLDQDATNGGRYLLPNNDYELIENGTKIRLSTNITMFDESLLVITQFGENQQIPAIAFRLFKDLNDNWNYYRIGARSTTELARTLNITDTEILVKDASVLAQPNTELAIPGIIMIGGERILYYGVDLENNKLTQIRRGIDGTGAVLAIPLNTLVQDASFLQRVPNAHNKVWYDQGKFDATNGLGLQYSTSEQVKFLLQDTALPVSKVFDVKYLEASYVTNGYVVGNLY